MNRSLKPRAGKLPTEPGVYIFKDREGTVIYVGKAKSLRNRVRSYFRTSSPADYKGDALRDEIFDFEVVVCETEVDALILESTLIKKHAPRYNVFLRDDKSYPYIAVTVSDDFPRVSLVRGKRRSGVRYYGPYVNARAARNTIRLLQKVFPLRHCQGKVPGRRGRSPCLYREIKMCMGPCTGDVDPLEYQRQVKLFCDFLEGRHREVVESLEASMRAASESQDYERAAGIRNRLESAREVLKHHRSVSTSTTDYDVIGLHRDELQACFSVAKNRQGLHLGNFCFFSDLAEQISDEELTGEFLKRYYDSGGSIPRQVFLKSLPPEDSAIQDWLTSQRGGKVSIKIPKRGRKVQELKTSDANARVALEGSKLTRSADRVRVERAMRELAEELQLKRFPLRIECYDISTMGGTSSVGSMVVFKDGLPEGKEYRRFKMKFTSGVDDVGMMKEVLYRRFKRYADESGREEKERKFSKLPDLILLDGGKGQLAAGIEVLRVMNIEGVEVAALAKRLEEVFRPAIKYPVVLPRNSEALFLLQRIRDEAHRVAVTYHRSLMEKRTRASWLDDVAGVGPKRKKALVRHLGSPGKVKAASVEKIASVPGIPAVVAQNVYRAARRLEEAEG